MFSLCPVVQMSVPWQHRHVSRFDRTNTEPISMKFVGTSHSRMNWVHFVRNCTRDKKDIKLESTSNQCCHVANDFTRDTCIGGGIIWPRVVCRHGTYRRTDRRTALIVASCLLIWYAYRFYSCTIIIDSWQQDKLVTEFRITEKI